jgi:tRNA threonylcarbamoyladenosine biosynthesis protein TsaB
MGVILCIETATRVCSVVVGVNGNMISKRESAGEYSHSRQITLFIQEVINEAGIILGQLDAVAISKGPGSFTGLRIGVSTAKGICFALDKPLISVGTLQSMALGMSHMAGHGISKEKDVLLCPMIDARRMEVYAALYTKENDEVLPPYAEIITGSSFSGYFSQHTIIFAGDGAEKCRDIFKDQPNAIFPEMQLPSAAHMISVAEKALAGKEFEDVACFEPYYLKDFVAGQPKVKGLK